MGVANVTTTTCANFAIMLSYDAGPPLPSLPLFPPVRAEQSR